MVWCGAQGTSHEDVQARVEHAKKREEVRRMAVTIHEDLMMHMAEGAQESKKSFFFTECFNFTTSVDRFKNGLLRSAKKERMRLEMNKRELEKIKQSVKLSDEDKKEAVQGCADVEEITKNKEATCKNLADAMASLVAQLRQQASTEDDLAQRAETEIYDEETGLLIGVEKKRVPYLLVSVLFVIAIILGSIKWYVWWTGDTGR